MKPADYFIKIGNATDTGKVRDLNEDYLAHFDTPLGYCIIICDGMGGHTSGNVASQTAIISIQQYLQDKQNNSPAIPQTLSNSIEFANFQLQELIKKDISLSGMGTTCVLALISSGQLYLAHAGDSRVYLIRKRKIRQLTKDHSSVQQLIDEGIITKEEASYSDKKNQISKAIGVFETVSPTVSEKPLKLSSDDIILLCSDGLTEHISENEILEIIQPGKDVQNMAVDLVNKANNKGGTDNITVQVVQFKNNPIL